MEAIMTLNDRIDILNAIAVIESPNSTEMESGNAAAFIRRFPIPRWIGNTMDNLRLWVNSPDAKFEYQLDFLHLL